MNKKNTVILLAALRLMLYFPVYSQTNYHQYVDPYIGTEGSGNVVIGPSCPYGMIKPGPDFNLTTNSGYSADANATLKGFSQVHVSGTGGGAKYGNIAVLPFGEVAGNQQPLSIRSNEKATIGYYSVNLKKWDITTEITASAKVGFYRFQYNKKGTRAVKIDAGQFLNEGRIPGEREAQFFVGSEIEIVSDHEIRGYNRIRGGWNYGGPFTVYFDATFDQPFTNFSTWKGAKIQKGQRLQFDSGEKTGALLYFNEAATATLQMKIGVSFISTAKANQNIAAEVPHWDFKKLLNETKEKWEKKLSQIELDASSSVQYKTMFYTALYHTMLMPVDRSDENPLWKSDLPYYDDYYAIWDIYRSSAPLITLIDPLTQTKIVNSLINIYRYDGYMPEARSGNSNGRTQGGSNADIMIADAYAKGLKGIDYKMALQAMIKNAEVPPGGNEEKEGRGGLVDYNTLGYVSDVFPRAGTRTVEYAYDDYCIAQLAKAMGEEDVYKKYTARCDNWKNLWRNIEDNGSTGFIMPKDRQGKWIDSIRCTVNKNNIRFMPTDNRPGSCVDWWAGFFYEGSSWDYSLFVPHDVKGLIAQAGGTEAFKKRLDTFFNKGFYNVSNEPDFLTPDLYHWLGRPDISSEKIMQITRKAYNTSRSGLPGNDDSGATSAWMAFHLIGLYPNAGQSYYLINTPFVKESTIHLERNQSLKITAKNLSEKNIYIQSAMLNNVPFNQSWIEHSEIIKGGTLVFEMGDSPGKWSTDSTPPSKTK